MSRRSRRKRRVTDANRRLPSLSAFRGTFQPDFSGSRRSRAISWNYPLARPQKNPYFVNRDRLRRLGRSTISARSSARVVSIPVGEDVFVSSAHPISRSTRVCVARSVRREVLHALGKAGSGARQKPPTFTWRSKVRCK